MTRRFHYLPLLRLLRPLAAGILFAVVVPAVFPYAVSGAGGSPAAMYTAALSGERGLRNPGRQPSLNDLRAAISTYEAIIRQFPRSDFDDHALWQGAGLAVEAYDRYRQAQDLETGTRLLRLLSHNHPTSSFTERVPERLRRLHAMSESAWLLDVARVTLPKVVRVTVTLDREVAFSSEHLSEPSRLFFDLRGTATPSHLRNATLVFTGDGDIVRSVRLGRHPGQITRVVLDTEETEGCHAFTLYEPFRLVVDCRRAHDAPGTLMAGGVPDTPWLTEPPLVPLQLIGVGLEPDWPSPLSARDSFANAIPRLVEDESPTERWLDPIPSRMAPPSANSDGVYSVARQLGLGISRIVIDPGHGGHDPGAHGRDFSEAALVLDLALRLQERLESTQPDLEVVLTRTEDEYVSLEERTALANRVGADLFLSIHANASKNPSARGVETYFLDLATDPESESLAARENVGGIATMKHLDGLLQTIATNSKLDESRDFAQTVQDAMLQSVRAVDPAVPDLGVKQAPFVVLIGARMPSILAEISFVTNNHDATLLTTDSYRERIVDGLHKGILLYHYSLGVDPIVSATNAGEM